MKKAILLHKRAIGPLLPQSKHFLVNVISFPDPCGLDKVTYSLDGGAVLCCDEGQVNNAGKCADFCFSGTAVDGVCPGEC